MGVDREHVDRASREAAYFAYAELFKQRLDLCRRAGIQAALAVGRTEREAAGFLTEAQKLWAEPIPEFDPAERLVQTFGSAQVLESANEASEELTAYRTVVSNAITADATSRAEHVRAARSAYGPVYRVYLEFLHAAADDIGSDEILKSGF
ncbi:hypothetical protein [Streptomyces sp. NRRL F-5123]|uniref:hypothetical protein n=1 Tax=Streptomyces sp. NRRL F-5123 TaxID=1463856 RepID=UPI0004E1BFAF|nr:hypothetical protein [Streptomyces sp. NRRL F-5123]